jgi:hypothetical protein
MATLGIFPFHGTLIVDAIMLMFSLKSPLS